MKKHLLWLSAVMVAPAVVFAQPTQTAPAPESMAPVSASGDIITATPDAATVAAAQKVVDHIFPAGTMQKMMGQQFFKMMQPMMDQVGSLQLSEFGQIAENMTDKPAEKRKISQQFEKMDKATIGELMDILDPYWKQRQAEMFEALRKPLSEMMASMEPEMRDGYTSFYSRHFSLDQLVELDRYFSTPTGNAYASQSMLVGTDPEVMKKMMSVMPKVIGKLPDMIGQIAEAEKNSKLPKRDISHLTPEQISKLSKLLGISEAELKSSPHRRRSR